MNSMLKLLRTRSNWNLGVWMCILFFSCRQPSSRLEKVHEIKSYASGSAMTLFKKKIYLMGDDMGYLLVTDTSFKMIDSIQLTPGVGRIPKNTKPDIESVTLLRQRKATFALLLGSGSVIPYRSKGWLINLETKQKTFIDLEPFYNRIRATGIKEINVEGLATASGGIFLANRGNKSFPKNYLIFTTPDFWNNQQIADIKVIKLGANSDTASFSGVSGLDYSYKSDRLFLTVSTENTYSTHADGAIGKSYLWIIDNISSKRRLAAVNPNRVINLDSVDIRFKGHKVESVCILSENKENYQLGFVADDDKGTSILFSLRLSKKP